MKKLNLDIIAATLEGLEDTIISRFIDRAQFHVNKIVYLPGKSGFAGTVKKSLFDLRLLHQEKMDAVFGRFCVPEERSFNTRLPAPRRRIILGDPGLVISDFNLVNITVDIRTAYDTLVPLLCADGDDGHYGSSVEHDVFALQALSRRIHYGSFYIAESKFRQDRAEYAKLISRQDCGALLERLTRANVEEAILERVRKKVAYAQAKVNRRVRFCIDPEVVLQFYRDQVIPLTKKGEVMYLLARSKKQPERR